MNEHLVIKMKGKIIVCPTCKQLVSLVELEHDMNRITNRMFDCKYCGIGFWIWLA